MISASPPYALDYGGRRFEVETRSAGWSTVGRLSIDGVPVDEGTSQNQNILLAGGGLTIVVRLNGLDRVTEVLAVPAGTNPQRAETAGLVFTPPAGSHAAKLDRLKREHPTLYAARHVVIAVGQVLIGVLGLGALLGALLPRIDLPHLPLPDLPWPDVPDLPWPDLPLPDIDLPPLPAVPYLDQIAALWSSISWLMPVVIALIAAAAELRKRRKRDQAETARRHEERYADNP